MQAHYRRSSCNVSQEAVRLWARLTGGLGRSQEAGEAEEDWEDLDEETLSDTDGEEEPELSEREKRILKGRLARAAIRRREEEVSVTHMPAKKDQARSTENLVTQRETRRNSTGRAGPPPGGFFHQTDWLRNKEKTRRGFRESQEEQGPDGNVHSYQDGFGQLRRVEGTDPGFVEQDGGRQD